MHHVVGLRSRTRTRIEPAGRFGRRTREVQEDAYYWTIDGTDLTTWITQKIQHVDPVAPREETIWLAGNTEDARERLDRLQGYVAPDFDNGRVALLTCPICGDLSCGAFTAELRLTAETVTWHYLGWDSAAPDEPPFLYEPPLSVKFERRNYDETLAAVRRLIELETAPRPS